jgi:hypothetical protein
MCNPRCGRRDDRERRSLSPEGPRPKAFGGNMHNVCFPKRLMCRAGGVDDDLVIIQFLHIYLADMARAWLNHLPRSSINC